MYEKHEMNIVKFEGNDAFVIGMYDAGHGYSEWSIRPDQIHRGR